MSITNEPVEQKVSENIPAAVRRAVLTASGHKCAADGESTSLDVHHIKPLATGGTNDPENLICLCANCHRRVHKEGWDQKTLKYYKDYPWVKYKGAGRPLDPKNMAKVRITIDMDFNQFDDMLKRLLHHGLAKFLEIPLDQIEIENKTASSVILTVKLPKKSAKRLIEAIKNSNPRLLSILGELTPNKIELVKQRRRKLSPLRLKESTRKKDIKQTSKSRRLDRSIDTEPPVGRPTEHVRVEYKPAKRKRLELAIAKKVTTKKPTTKKATIKKIVAKKVTTKKTTSKKKGASKGVVKKKTRVKKRTTPKKVTGKKVTGKRAASSKRIAAKKTRAR